MAAVLTVKEIKPARFKSKAFRDAMLKAAKQAGKEIEKDFKATTATWNHKVKFETAVSVDPNVEVLVGTDDEIYGYVNYGTRPHPIFAKKGKALVFPWGGPGSYRAKTRPKVIGSSGGGATGPIVAFPYVQHPGTKAREFDKVIQKKWTPRFKRLMEQAMSRAAKASGHGT